MLGGVAWHTAQGVLKVMRGNQKGQERPLGHKQESHNPKYYGAGAEVPTVNTPEIRISECETVRILQT